MARCWCITDGSAGMVAQVRALAQALGIECEMKTIALKKKFSWQPNAIWAAGYRHLILDYALDKSKSDALDGPWPQLVISCGRKAALVAMGMRSQMVGSGQWSVDKIDNLSTVHRPLPTHFIHIQDPQCPAHYFDLVIAMAHDKITGSNVIKTRFALHAMTQATLAEARGRFAPRFAAYPKPHVAVLIGGSTNKYILTARAMKKIISQLERLLALTIGSLLITPSRRTGEANIALLEARFVGNNRVYIYDGKEENPYMGLLALADYVVVTNDSVNMMSEAHATGKPLYLLPLPGHKRTKPARFAARLIKDDIARPLSTTLQPWNYPASDEMERLVKNIRILLPSLRA